MTKEDLDLIRARNEVRKQSIWMLETAGMEQYAATVRTLIDSTSADIEALIAELDRRPECPDDSGLYDDETLIDIIAEGFERSPNAITCRDGRWIIAKLAEARAEVRRLTAAVQQVAV